ncbi:50S ribosomal protein L11 methyltransferase [Halonatronum saccharophilum]|uniref:50S ribosomal protein L11 methyltransferase n=1 Tax=Halonatronum saccharophilum TaxID=150060 RepID=UPI00048286B6|nr:50S ribosomal protein L11 methyltransferase [Halonatronum saccharophilum]
MDLKEVIVLTDHQSFSAIENILEELGALGITKEEFKEKPKEVRLKAYFDEEDFSKVKLDEIKDRIFSLEEYGFELSDVEISVDSLQEEDWANKWKDNFKPIKISEKIIIKPTWEDYKCSKDDIIIELDPGRAFGTGDHGTTSVCLRMIEKYLKPGVNFLDIGTGTGILSIAAAKLGVGDILALDIDPVAVKVARENGRLNRVEDRIEFKIGNLIEVVNKKYDFCVANILPHIILNLIPDLPKVIKEGGHFLLSGIIEEKVEEIEVELEKYNLELLERCQEGEWITLVGIRRG